MALATLQRANSPAAMRQAVVDHPILLQPEMLTAIEQAIAQQVPPQHRPAFNQRLVWLRKIASE